MTRSRPNQEPTETIGEVHARHADRRPLARLTERPGYILTLLSAVYGVSVLDRQLLAILMQPIKAELGFSDTQLGFLSGIAFAVFYATLGIPIAKFADKTARVPIIIASLATFSAATALCGAVSSFSMLMLVRVFVAVGEAGTTPASTSIIGDLFDDQRRVTAMAIFASGASVGSLAGLTLGGVLAQWIGWRGAFFILGASGLAVALLLILTLREPQRHQPTECRSPVDPDPSIWEACRILWVQRSLRHVILGASLILMFLYGIFTWFPSHLQRSYALSVGETGLHLGLVFGITGFFGTLASGMIADRLGQHDPRWRAWIAAVAAVAMAPLYGFVLYSHSLVVSLYVIVIPATLGVFYIAPTYALVQSLAPRHLRATAIAIMLLTVNLIGMGLGPQLIGWGSDLLMPRLGVESIRVALIASLPLLPWSAWHFHLATKTLKKDIEHVRWSSQ